MLKPLFSNPFTVEWAFSLDNNKAAPLYFSAADVTSMLHDCCLLLHGWFLWHTGSYYRKWVFLQRGCEPNRKVTRNKSSLAISVSLEPCAKSCGSIVASPWSSECVFVCVCTRVWCSGSLGLYALSIRLAAVCHWFSLCAWPTVG